MISAADRLSLGPTSCAVAPRSMMMSPWGTGAAEGCHVVIWVGSSSSTLRRRRRVTLRCEPRGPPPPRGGLPRPGAPVAGAPAPAPPGPPGRGELEKPPGRGATPVRGGLPGPERGAPVRGPPGPVRGPVDVGLGARRWPGGGGIGRPVTDICRPGGGGIGRPVVDIGGRGGAVGDSPPSPAAGRCVGRMVVGAVGEAGRGLATLGVAATVRVRTPREASGAAEVAGAAGSPGRSCGAAKVLVAVTSEAVTTGAGSAAAATVSVFDPALVFLAGSSGATSRLSPSASTLRRIRSAWASSIEAEELLAPMPNCWATASSSLLVRPSSLESSCTRIFFCAKTIPYLLSSHRRGQFPILPQSQPLLWPATAPALLPHLPQ